MGRISLQYLSLERAWNTFRAMPTTNVRIGVTVLVWFLVGWAEIMMFLWTREWKPIPPSFAGLLAVMSGLDAVQFVGKRRTHDRFNGHDPETDE